MRRRNTGSQLWIPRYTHGKPHIRHTVFTVLVPRSHRGIDAGIKIREVFQAGFVQLAQQTTLSERRHGIAGRDHDVVRGAAGAQFSLQIIVAGENVVNDANVVFLLEVHQDAWLDVVRPVQDTHCSGRLGTGTIGGPTQVHQHCAGDQPIDRDVLRFLKRLGGHLGLRTERTVERAGIEAKLVEQFLGFAQALCIDQFLAPLVIASPLLGLPENPAESIKRRVGHLP